MRPPDNDTLLFFDFRSDRMREISEAFGYEAKKFEPAAVRQGLHITTFTQYKASFPFPVMFAQQSMDNVLAEWLGKQKVPQFHIAGKRRASEGVFDTFACAETEKYAHVTFFFNGGIEKQFDLEERAMVPSPKVATYDLQPEMSAGALTDKAVAAIGSGQYDMIVLNFANPDMVGHTGSLPAAIRAVETVDTCLGRIADAVQAAGGALLVTADHGNAEMMRDPVTGGPHTAHTTNKVPVLLLGGPAPGLADGRLADVAPTLLALMGLPQPVEMTGRSLLR